MFFKRKKIKKEEAAIHTIVIVSNLSDAPDENKTILRLLEFNRIKRICNPYSSPKILSKIGVFTQGQCIFAQIQDQRDSDCRFEFENWCDNINEMHADNNEYLQRLREYGLRFLKSYTHVRYEY